VNEECSRRNALISTTLEPKEPGKRAELTKKPGRKSIEGIGIASLGKKKPSSRAFEN
jgi:hypothetical protein